MQTPIDHTAHPARAAESAVTQASDQNAWTTRRLLAWMTGRFTERDVDAPRIVAEMLLSHVLECDRMRLYMEVDRVASAEELEALRALVGRASKHEPVQYLVGRASFFASEFIVDDSTMIPQPCTEDLVELALVWYRARAGISPGMEPDVEDHSEAPIEPSEDPDDAPSSELAESAASLEPPPAPELPSVKIADIGTGSGCIAVSLARQIRNAQIVATDIAPDALALAQRNAERLGVHDRIEFIAGPTLEPLREHAPFDLICANAPYISDAEWDAGEVQMSVREFVPARALRGGPDGLDVIRPLIGGAGALLAEDGLLLLEIGHAQRDLVLALAESAPHLREVEVRKDHEGYWRILMARK